jgi:hypothetical protein
MKYRVLRFDDKIVLVLAYTGEAYKQARVNRKAIKALYPCHTLYIAYPNGGLIIAIADKV